MNRIFFALVMILFLTILGCSKSSDSASDKTATSGGGSNATDSRPSGKTGNCQSVAVLPDSTTGGCRIRLVTPSTCNLVDISDGKTYEVAWTTDGTTCETPWKITLAGNPVTELNAYETNVSTNGNSITQKGGYFRIDATAFEGLTSDNGQYHWVVKSFFGSHPASVNFTVKK